MIEITNGDIKIRGSRVDIISDFSCLSFALLCDTDFTEIVKVVCKVILELDLESKTKKELEEEYKKRLNTEVENLINEIRERIKND